MDKKFEHLIGKRVKVKKATTGEWFYGVLTFAGINTLLHNQFQVTISRMPIWPVNPKDIHEI